MTDPEKVCERCKWWDGDVTPPPGAERGAFGHCTSPKTRRLVRNEDGNPKSTMMHWAFGCRFWGQRAPKETQSCETEEKA